MSRVSAILLAAGESRRGNPVILAFEHREAILGGGRNLGCRRLVDNNPDLVTPVAMDDDHVVFDLDTPADYRHLLQRLASGTAGCDETRALAVH